MIHTNHANQHFVMDFCIDEFDIWNNLVSLTTVRGYINTQVMKSFLMFNLKQGFMSNVELKTGQCVCVGGCCWLRKRERRR